MRAALMIMTVMFSSEWNKVEATRIIGLKGQKIPDKTILERKTNYAREQDIHESWSPAGIKKRRKNVGVDLRI